MMAARMLCSAVSGAALSIRRHLDCFGAGGGLAAAAAPAGGVEQVAQAAAGGAPSGGE